MTDLVGSRRELGRFFAERRSRLTPEAVGIPRIGRRRVHGLRREEVAALAGVSPTWYSMLEAGTAQNVSKEVLHAVARVLRLSEAETSYALSLAYPRQETSIQAVSEAIATVVRSSTLPSYVIDREWYARDWNKQFLEFWGLRDVAPPLDVVRTLLLDEPARSYHGIELAKNALPVVAMIRSGFGRRNRNERYIELAAMLDADPTLGPLWRESPIADPLETHHAVLSHPVLGKVSYATVNADIPNSGLTLVFYVVSESMD